MRPSDLMRRGIIFLFFALILSCKSTPPADEQMEVVVVPASDHAKIDLDNIRERGTLIALTRFNANSYFIYRGQPMGFEYELLERFAAHLGVPLEIKTPDSWGSLFEALESGEGDIVAANVTITKSRVQSYLFSDHHTTTRQVLVQRMPANWRNMKRHRIEQSLIRTPIDLIGKEVHVRRSSAYFNRLKNLSDEIGGDIQIIEVAEDVETEDLINMVADGKIEYTVADENIALINKTYLPNIDVKTPMSLPQRLAWALRKTSPNLCFEINQWLTEIKGPTNPTFNVIYNKYYRNQRHIRKRLESDYYVRTTGKLSPYDDAFREVSGQINWDWRLLAALSFQESQFDPMAKSWAGAVGLMQLMPPTAREFGVSRLTDPEQNLLGGVQYIAWLQNYWKVIPDSTERRKFILASYNVGQGHVQDARRLAQKYGADPDKWDGHVAEYILKKANPEFYTDEVVEYGYCRGREPYDYVREIMAKYQLYRQYVGEEFAEKG